MFEEWNKIAKVWDKNMQDGDWFQRNVIYPAILDIIPNVSNMKVVDIGCGNGHLSRFLSKIGGNIFGIDNSEEMINYCKSYNLNINFENLDITSDDIPYNNFFDIAIFNNSMQDMKDYEKGLNNAYKMLKSGGELLIVVKHPCFHGRSDGCGWRVTTERGDTFTTGHGLTELEKNKSKYDADYFLMDDYFNKSEHVREWYGLKTTSYARTLHEYINAIIKANFTIQSVTEPVPILDGKQENPYLYNLLVRIPNFICFYARKI